MNEDEALRRERKKEGEEKFRLILQYRCSEIRSKERQVFYSYRQLLDFLHDLTEDQLDQQIQILTDECESGKASLLEPIIGSGTVEQLCHANDEVISETRNVMDFKHHPEQVVLLRDGPPYSEDGDTAYEMVKDGFIGNVTGKFKPWVTRKNAEPTIQASRSPIMQPQSQAQTTDLEKRLEELCQLSAKEGLSEEQTKEAESIMLEFYRRIYRLSPREDLEE